jgi:hypothetical protein
MVSAFSSPAAAGQLSALVRLKSRLLRRRVASPRTSPMNSNPMY